MSISNQTNPASVITACAKTGLADPKFKYVSAAKTDISKTFSRIRSSLARQALKEKNRKAPVKFILGDD